MAKKATKAKGPSVKRAVVAKQRGSRKSETLKRGVKNVAR